MQQRNTSICKRKELEDITNTVDIIKRFNLDMTPSAFDDTKMTETKQLNYREHTQVNESKLDRNYQNVHPLLPWYKHDLETGHISYEQFQSLMSVDHEEELLDFLVQYNLHYIRQFKLGYANHLDDYLALRSPFG